jgi:hypothetical protein
VKLGVVEVAVELLERRGWVTVSDLCGGWGEAGFRRGVERRGGWERPCGF